MNKAIKKTISYFVLSVFFLLQALPYLPSSVQTIPLLSSLNGASFINPPPVDAAGLSSASATLSNPRLSFDAIANANIAIGGSTGVTQASGTGGDYDTLNLFPNDSLLITGNSAIAVASVAADLVTFSLRSPLTSAATGGSTHMTVAQSGTLTVAFYTAAPIPLGGSIKISVPAPTSGGTDGVPLSNPTLAGNGFDTNGMTNANTTCPGGFTASTFTAGSSGTPHTFTCNNAGATVPAGANISFVIGVTIGLVNPAPVQGKAAGSRGVADIYSIIAGTYSSTAGGGVLIEDVQMKTAPVEGVLVSATVDETLQFTVAGYNAGANTRCGLAHTAGITTTATSVPWGLIASGYTIDKNDAVQQLTVTTNAASGYKVYAEENDQMGDDGSACTGTAPSAGEYTFGTATCIRDAGVGSISHTVAADWGATPGSNYGFAYSLENSSGTDAKFVYNTTGVHDSKQFADQAASEDKYATDAELMSNAGPVSSSSVFVCYRINIPGTQPAGYYYNKIKYTAVPKF